MFCAVSHIMFIPTAVVIYDPADDGEEGHEPEEHERELRDEHAVGGGAGHARHALDHFLLLVNEGEQRGQKQHAAQP